MTNQDIGSILLQVREKLDHISVTGKYSIGEMYICMDTLDQLQAALSQGYQDTDSETDEEPVEQDAE